MIAADLPIQRPAGARLLVAGRDGRHRTLAPRRLRAPLPHRRPGDRERCRDAARQPDRDSMCPAGGRSRCAWRAATRSRRSPGFRPCCSGLVTSARARRIGRCRRPFTRAIAWPSALSARRSSACTIIRGWSHWRSTARPTSSGRGWRATAVRSSTAHLAEPLALWDTWTSIAGTAGRVRAAIGRLRARLGLRWRRWRNSGVQFATITHAAGISSTGDPMLDALLPFDEPYRIPASTAAAIRARAPRRAGASSPSARPSSAHSNMQPQPTGSSAPGEGIGVAEDRCRPRRFGRRMRCSPAPTSRGTSHYELLRAFADEAMLTRIDDALEAQGYRTHEFGDSVFLEAASDARAARWAS